MSRMLATLQDGFAEGFRFHGHKLNVRQFNVIEVVEDLKKQSQFSSVRETYLSLDIKQIIVWENNNVYGHGTPKILHQYKFPKSQPNFICSIVFLPKMKVYVAAALDMTFKIFDKKLNLLESIHHEERAILQLEYDVEKDIILSSGASGISVWKLSRNISLDMAHIMEKMYTFEGCTGWVHKMIYEPKLNRVYAINDRTAKILSISRRSLITVIEDKHDAPLSVVCWYERSQFYITGCTRGEIKCWTSNYSQTNKEKIASGVASGPNNTISNPHNNEYQNNNGKTKPDDATNKQFALLHIFKGHTKAVTAIKLHPISGLAITTGMDGIMKVLNLELLNELFVLNMNNSILDLRIISLGGNSHACLIAQNDATVSLWRITSCCNFFNTISADISSAKIFENLQLDQDIHNRQNSYNNNSNPYQFLNIGGMNKLDSPSQEDVYQHNLSMSDSSSVISASIPLNIQNRLQMDLKTDPGNAHGEITTLELAQLKEQHATQIEQMKADRKAPAMVLSEVLTTNVLEKAVVAFSSQDLRVFASSGAVLARMEPEHVLVGILSYALSLYQKQLFCLCEDDTMRIYDISKLECPLLAIHSIRGGSYEEDLGRSLALINTMPQTSSTSNVNPTRDSTKKTARGDRVPPKVEEILLVGMKNGTVLFMDTLHQCEAIMSMQAHNGIVLDIQFRRKRQELFVLGRSMSDTNQAFTVRAWRLPELTMLFEVQDLKNVSCFAISPSLGHFGVGCNNGTVRLFNIPANAKANASSSGGNGSSGYTEVIKLGQSHDFAVADLTFCDELRVYSTCSSDKRVFIWNYDKQFVRGVRLNNSSCCVQFLPEVGNVLVVQGKYLLLVPRGVWDSGNALFQVKNQQDPWATNDSDSDEDATGVDSTHLYNHNSANRKLPTTLSLVSAKQAEGGIPLKVATNGTTTTSSASGAFTSTATGASTANRSNDHEEAFSPYAPGMSKQKRRSNMRKAIYKESQRILSTDSNDINNNTLANATTTYQLTGEEVANRDSISKRIRYADMQPDAVFRSTSNDSNSSSILPFASMEDRDVEYVANDVAHRQTDGSSISDVYGTTIGDSSNVSGNTKQQFGAKLMLHKKPPAHRINIDHLEQRYHSRLTSTSTTQPAQPFHQTTKVTTTTTTKPIITQTSMVDSSVLHHELAKLLHVDEDKYDNTEHDIAFHSQLSFKQQQHVSYQEADKQYQKFRESTLLHLQQEKSHLIELSRGSKKVEFPHADDIHDNTWNYYAVTAPSLQNNSAYNSNYNANISHSPQVIQKAAQIGLSPRARLTLLNSSESRHLNGKQLTPKEVEKLVLENSSMKVSKQYLQKRKQMQAEQDKLNNVINSISTEQQQKLASLQQKHRQINREPRLPHIHKELEQVEIPELAASISRVPPNLTSAVDDFIERIRKQNIDSTLTDSSEQHISASAHSVRVIHSNAFDASRAGFPVIIEVDQNAPSTDTSALTNTKDHELTVSQHGKIDHLIYDLDQTQCGQSATIDSTTNSTNNKLPPRTPPRNAFIARRDSSKTNTGSSGCSLVRSPRSSSAQHELVNQLPLDLIAEATEKQNIQIRKKRVVINEVTTILNPTKSAYDGAIGNTHGVTSTNSGTNFSSPRMNVKLNDNDQHDLFISGKRTK